MVPLEKFLGETLARLQLRRGAGRSECGPATAVKLIDYAERERQFWAYDG
jgi:hypothetical protein